MSAIINPERVSYHSPDLDALEDRLEFLTNLGLSLARNMDTDPVSSRRGGYRREPGRKEFDEAYFPMMRAGYKQLLVDYLMVYTVPDQAAVQSADDTPVN